VFVVAAIQAKRRVKILRHRANVPNF
jgi:hypothetical protein